MNIIVHKCDSCIHWEQQGNTDLGRCQATINFSKNEDKAVSYLTKHKKKGFLYVASDVLVEGHFSCIQHVLNEEKKSCHHVK